jgi:tRNA 2-selenouridine synthase
MNKAVLIEIEVAVQSRIQRLIEEYSHLPCLDMELAIKSLSKRIGEVRKNEILLDYREGRWDAVADKLLNYYDKSYHFSTLKYKNKGIKLNFPNGNAAENARVLLETINKNGNN